MNLRKLIPHSAKPSIKQLLFKYYLYSPLQGPIPPEWSIFTGNGNFVDVGNLILKRLVEEGGLRPYHKVLDPGCGMGRVALPLTNFLDQSAGGSYDGFDIVKKGTDWCKNKYKKWKNFTFIQADVYNSHYNSQGQYRASEYRFPYPDNTFDMVFLNSVFTHMLTADVENYLAEVTRVLKPGGICSITYFLMVPDAIEDMESGKANQGLVFKPSDQVYWVKYANDPEHATGYPVEYIESLYKKSGLTVEKILYGSWCGREKFYEFQDVLFGRKSLTPLASDE